MPVATPPPPVPATLPPAPAGLAVTRESLHLLAARVVAPFHTAVTGTEIDLRWTPGGFGTPVLDGERQVRVEGTDIVVAAGGSCRRQPITSCRDAAQFVGGPSAGRIAEPLTVDVGAARYLGELFGFAFAVLSDLQSELEATTRPILWPEHFDYAIEAGAPERRATYGISPGDEHHPEPYAYVGPWAPRSGPGWDAVAFSGAELGLGDGASHTAVRRFFCARAAAL